MHSRTLTISHATSPYVHEFSLIRSAWRCPVAHLHTVFFAGILDNYNDNAKNRKFSDSRVSTAYGSRTNLCAPAVPRGIAYVYSLRGSPRHHCLGYIIDNSLEYLWLHHHDIMTTVGISCMYTLSLHHSQRYCEFSAYTVVKAVTAKCSY